MVGPEALDAEAAWGSVTYKAGKLSIAIFLENHSKTTDLTTRKIKSVIPTLYAHLS
jgi:hypothetical protein